MRIGDKTVTEDHVNLVISKLAGRAGSANGYQSPLIPQPVAPDAGLVASATIR